MSDPVAPPQNLEAERELLGAVLVYYAPPLLDEIQPLLRDDDFYRRTHQIIYRAIVAVAAKGDHVDARTVARFLQCHRDGSGQTYLDAAGGHATLELLATYAVAHGIKERAEIVAEDGQWRRRLDAAYDAIDAIHARDEGAYQEAVGNVAPRLRVIEGGEAVAS